MDRKTKWITIVLTLLSLNVVAESSAHWGFPRYGFGRCGIGGGVFVSNRLGYGGFGYGHFRSYQQVGYFASDFCGPGFVGGFVGPTCIAPPLFYPQPIVLNVPTVVPVPFRAPVPRAPAPVHPPDPAPAAGNNQNAPIENFALPNIRRQADPVDEIRRRVEVLKRSTPQGRQRADRSISSGDAAFAKQSYARATSRYREAVARAPDYAEGHFRLAHMYIASRQFDLALKSALTALELSGTARRDGFSLADMYQGNGFARQKDDERLLDASLREPNDGGLQFLIGLTLHYGGNPLKAREHFQKAAGLAGPQQDYVRHFLPITLVAEPIKAEAEVANARLGIGL